MSTIIIREGVEFQREVTAVKGPQARTFVKTGHEQIEEKKVECLSAETVSKSNQ